MPGYFTRETLEYAEPLGVEVQRRGRHAVGSQEAVTHLHRTLATRSTIEQAKGVLMRRHDLSSTEAFTCGRPSRSAATGSSARSPGRC